MASSQLDDADNITEGERLGVDDTSIIDKFEEEEISLEELEEKLAEEEREAEFDEDGPVDTQHGDGTAYYPLKSQQQGLVYDPPDDPPILPSDDPQGIEIATGFAKESQLEDPRSEYVPERLAGGDWDLQGRIKSVLHKSSLTNQMTGIQVQVQDGIAYLSGKVETLDDIDVVCSVVQQIEGVVDVEEELIVTSL
jgi:hypothetical protein